LWICSPRQRNVIPPFPSFASACLASAWIDTYKIGRTEN
jgi:hypothetical protein